WASCRAVWFPLRAMVPDFAVKTEPLQDCCPHAPALSSALPYLDEQSSEEQQDRRETAYPRSQAAGGQTARTDLQPGLEGGSGSAGTAGSGRPAVRIEQQRTPARALRDCRG